MHHGGPSSTGEYLHTLQMIDVATGWSERVAVLGRSALVMEAAFRRILTRLPFPIIELHPDNGSEFLNYHLLKLLQRQPSKACASRAAGPGRRMIIVTSSSATTRWCGLIWATTASIRWPRPWRPTSSTTRCGSTTTSFSRCCTSREKTLVVADGQRPHVKRRYDTASTPFDRLCAGPWAAR